MGYKHSREELLDAAVGVAHEHGISNLSFGRVAARLGINDRTVVYYFPSKAALVGEVLLVLGARLQVLLEGAFGPDPRPVTDLLADAWSTLATVDADPTFAAFFEVTGLASAGVDPYPEVAAGLVAAWQDWLVPRIATTPGGDRTGAALGLIAQLDGLLLLRQVAGPAAADAAARALGVVGRRRAR